MLRKKIKRGREPSENDDRGEAEVRAKQKHRPAAASRRHTEESDSEELENLVFGDQKYLKGLTSTSDTAKVLNRGSNEIV